MPARPKRPEDRVRRNKVKVLEGRMGEVPEAPENLPDYLLHAWVSFWESPAASLISEGSDYLMVCRLFRLYAAADEAMSAMEDDPSPASINAAVKLSAECRMLENALGMNPRSRASLGVVSGSDPEGSLDDYL